MTRILLTCLTVMVAMTWTGCEPVEPVTPVDPEGCVQVGCGGSYQCIPEGQASLMVYCVEPGGYPDTGQVCTRKTDGKCGFVPKAAPKCVRAGCSGQLCVSADAPTIYTTCEWRDEYACLQQLPCEVQPDGKCGFTYTNATGSCGLQPLNP